MATKRIALCTADLRAPLKSATNLKNTILPKDLKFDMYLEVSDDLYKQIEDDAVLAEKIFKGVSKDFKKAVADLAAVAKDIDVEFGKSVKPKGWAEKEWKKRAPDILDTAEASMLAHARDQVAKWQRVRKDRKKYVIKSVAKVTVGSLGVATATLGTVVAAGGTAASGGGAIPGLIAAIYANVKAVVQLAKVVNRLRRDVDAAEKDLQKDLRTLVQAYEKNGSKGVAAKEMGKAAVEQFLATTMSSISSAENGLSDFKGKLDGVDIKVSEMGIKLNRILTEQEKLDREIDRKITKQLAGTGYKSKKLPKLLASNKKLANKVNELLNELPKALDRVEKARNRYRTSYKPTLAALKAKKPGWVDYAQMSLKLGDLALGAGFTDFAAADSILVLVDSIGVEVDDVLTEKIL